MLMVGHDSRNRCFFFCYISWTACLVAPLLIVAIIVFDCIKYEPITVSEAYPDWAEALGWLLVAFIMMWLPLWFIINYFRRGGASLCLNLNQPTVNWGPAKLEHRTLPRYQRLLAEPGWAPKNGVPLPLPVGQKRVNNLRNPANANPGVHNTAFYF